MKFDDDFMEDDSPYNEKAREEQLDNEELNPEEEGFLRGYEEEKDNAEEHEFADEDERISD